MRPRFPALLGLALCALLPAERSWAQSVHVLKTDAPVERIIRSEAGTFVKAGELFYSAVACGSPAGLCLTPAHAPAEAAPAPAGALPDGRIAVAGTGDIRRAWYARPTGRYAHGVLGDSIEGGSLIVVNAEGRQSEFVLPDSLVFEDLTPRIADLDGDGTNEVIAIRSSRSGGAAIALYGIAAGQLVELAAGSENGRANRWLNIAGFVPRPAGGLTIYGVRTPHINGRLFSLVFRNGTLVESNDIAADVSNHKIGSRELGLSAVGEFGGKLDLILPSQNHQRLRFPLSGRADIALPGEIDKAIAIVDGVILASTDDGVLVAVSP